LERPRQHGFGNFREKNADIFVVAGNSSSWQQVGYTQGISKSAAILHGQELAAAVPC
jgi:hypothetical protein